MPTLCKDCRYFDPARSGLPGDDGMWAHCLHPQAVIDAGPNLVTGGPPITVQRWCEVMRGAYCPCGPEAKLFEARGFS